MKKPQKIKKELNSEFFIGILISGFFLFFSLNRYIVERSTMLEGIDVEAIVLSKSNRMDYRQYLKVEFENKIYNVRAYTSTYENAECGKFVMLRYSPKYKCLKDINYTGYNTPLYLGLLMLISFIYVLIKVPIYHQS